MIAWQSGVFCRRYSQSRHLRSFSIAAAWFREDTTLHCAFSPSPAKISLEVEYCRANGISMVPRLIGQAPVIALVCEM